MNSHRVNFLVKVTLYLAEEWGIDLAELPYDQKLMAIKIVDGYSANESVNNVAASLKILLGPNHFTES